MAISGKWDVVIAHPGLTKMIPVENRYGKVTEQEVKVMPMERATARKPMELDYRNDTHRWGHSITCFEKSADGKTVLAQGIGAHVDNAFVGVATGDTIIVSDATHKSGEARYEVTSPVENYGSVYDMWRATLTRMPA